MRVKKVTRGATLDVLYVQKLSIMYYPKVERRTYRPKMLERQNINRQALHECADELLHRVKDRD